MRERRIFSRALITGITGSGGSYLAEYVVTYHPEVEVHGISRWHSTTASDNLSRIRDKVTIHECDLTDLSSVIRVLRAVKPDVILHIASHANVHASFVTPLAVLENNVMGTANLLEGIRIEGLRPIFLLCSTSEVYGQVFPNEIPISEDQPLRCCSPYAVSKASQDLLGFAYFKSYGIPVIRTRMFAYLNSRRADLFATSFALQVARIEAGLQTELRHGNLDSVRTLIDVRDAMEAYWVAVELCEAGEVYNIGGEKTITVGEFLELLKEHSKSDVRCRLDPALLRPSDVTLQIPNVSKFQRVTGWKPRYTFEESVRYLLNECRAQVARELQMGNTMGDRQAKKNT